MNTPNPPQYTSPWTKFVNMLRRFKQFVTPGLGRYVEEFDEEGLVHFRGIGDPDQHGELG